jgi:hypothetical protein
MARDESGGYDLARGFETMIEGDRAIEQAIRDLQTSMVTLLSMNKNLGDGASGSTSSGLTGVLGKLNTALTGLTTSQQLGSGGASAASDDAARTGQTVAAAPGGEGGGGGGGVTPKAPASAPGEGANTQGIAGGSGQGMGEGLVRAVPFVDTAMQGLDEFRSQRDKNARYQALVGGTNIQAMDNRWEEEKYRWSTAGIMSGEESRKTYMGLTAAGFRDDGPDEGKGSSGTTGYNIRDAENFIEMSKSAGLSVDQGLAQMDTLSRNPALNMKDMETAIQSLSKAAKDSGVNFSMMEEHLITLTEIAGNAGFGEGSSQFAKAMTLQATQRGQAFASTTDYSGTTTQMQTRAAAARLGMSPNEYYARQANGEDVASQGQDAAMEQVTQNLSAEALNWLKGKIAEYPDMNENDAMAIAKAYMMKFKDGPDFFAIKTVAENMTGKTYASIEMALVDIIFQLAGKTAEAASKEGTQLSADELGDLGKKKNVGGTLLESVPFVGGGLNGAVMDATGLTTSESAAAQSYVDRVNAGGEQSDLLNGLFQNIGGSGADTTKVKVYDKNGSASEMTVQEALDKDPTGEILKGAEFIDGEDLAGEDLKGRSVDEVAGLSGIEDEGEKGLIGLTDEARKWFTYSNGADEADSTGMPKPSLMEQTTSFLGRIL